MYIIYTNTTIGNRSADDYMRELSVFHESTLTAAADHRNPGIAPHSSRHDEGARAKRCSCGTVDDRACLQRNRPARQPRLPIPCCRTSLALPKAGWLLHHLAAAGMIRKQFAAPFRRGRVLQGSPSACVRPRHAASGAPAFRVAHRLVLQRSAGSPLPQDNKKPVHQHGFLWAMTQKLIQFTAIVLQ